MKKQFAALLTALSLLPTLALAQEYYTLPEIREQAKDGWHETYTDKYCLLYTSPSPRDA